MKKILMTLLLLSSFAVAFTACGGAASTNSVTVHTDMMSFIQTSITLKKGQSLQLVNDASDAHTISLGTWQKGVAQPEQEPDAPKINNEQLSSNGNLTVGPWNTAGTYQIYCPIHVNMKLTVIVQ